MNRVRWFDSAILAVTLIGLVAGAVLGAAGPGRSGDVVWGAVAALGLVLALWWVIDAALHRRIGVDVIAVAALGGAIAVGEYLAGAIVTVMLATGRALEAWAAGRAERSLQALLRSGPQIAHRYDNGGLTTPPLDQVRIGDLLLVQPGEVVPVDGIVRSAVAELDESAITGESVPVAFAAGDEIRAGAVNAGGPFDLTATTNAEQSTYAGIVRLVREASAGSSPLVRLADRFALVFLAASFALAGAAWWWSGDAERAVAVLVVATPCPLVLAAPVAIVSGLSRAARRGVVVKGGGALEALGQAEILLFDKTGTLTSGHPTMAEIICADQMPDGLDATDLLRLAASLDQVSPHVLAVAIVRTALARQLELTLPTETSEVAGAGVRGIVDGRSVAVGSATWVGADVERPWVIQARRHSGFEGAVIVFVAVDGVPAGALVLRDPIRTDSARTIRHLRASGIRRVVMVTGDRREVAEAVGSMIGIDAIEAEQSPADKLAVVRRETATGRTIMVGDGINDAPALASATVGVAIGARGASASSEAADVVLTVDRLDRLGEARLIARRSRMIATQSIVVGMGLSLVAMVVAAAGHLAATAGALLQEVIDIAVIVNALRAVRPGAGEVRLDPSGSDLALRLADEHQVLRPEVDRLRLAAELLGNPEALSSGAAMAAVRSAQRWIRDDLEPHERHEDQHLYPAVASALGGSDPTGPMSRSHAEIARLSAQLGMVVERCGDAAPSGAELGELQRLLYGLFAVLELHFAQEDESYLSLADDRPAPTIDRTTERLDLDEPHQ